MSALAEAPGAALRRRILSLADTKRLLGIRYSDWLLGAPSIEDGIACSGMAQDEWGHARLLYALLKELDEDPAPVEQDREPEAYVNAPALDAPPETWEDVVALMYAVDGALTVALEGFGAGSFEVAAGRIPKMLDEERFHRDLAAAWVRRLAAGGEGREALAGAVERILPATLAWLAPADGVHAGLADAGLDAPAAGLEARWLERIAPGLEALGLEPPTRPTGGWDEARARGPGAPDTEAVERARGIRNRALFVE
ncbi:MAG: Phenylacetic acid catabolic protein [Longimicrobiales bacterium]|nr:Phenylacetic acid catabolic protein [Longimicrobiales bacterium]